MIGCRVVLSVAICFVVWSGSAMDRPGVVTVLKKSVKKFPTAEQANVAFIENDRVVVHQKKENPPAQVIHLFDDRQPINLSLSCSAQKCHSFITTDQSKKRALLWCRHEDDYSYNVAIYDSTKNDVIECPDIPSNVRHGHSVDHCHWKNCFDESKPSSILTQVFMIGTVESYDYLAKDDAQDEGKLSSFAQDHRRWNHAYVFDLLRKIPAIVSQISTGFMISYGSNFSKSVLISKEIQSLKKSVPNRHYLCSSDRSFIAYYSQFLQDDCSCQGKGLENNHMRTCLSNCNVCYILHIKGSSPIRLHNNGVGVTPCAMAIHPNNKAIVTMSAGKRTIEYWAIQDGSLIKRQRLCSSVEGNFTHEVGTYGEYVSFSANGKLLAAAFPKQYMILSVPFDVLYGVGAEKKVPLILWLLRDCLLPKELVQLLMKNIMKVS